MVKLCDRELVIAAASMRNDKVLPSYQENGVPLVRTMTDRGKGYCGNQVQHKFVHLELEGDGHTRTKTKSLQTECRCKRFHQTIQNKFYASASKRKHYSSMDHLQADVKIGRWDNEKHRQSGKHCYGKTH